MRGTYRHRATSRLYDGLKAGGNVVPLRKGAMLQRLAQPYGYRIHLRPMASAQNRQ